MAQGKLSDLHEEKEIEQSSFVSLDPSTSVGVWQKKNKDGSPNHSPAPTTKHKPAENELRKLQSDASKSRPISIARDREPVLPPPSTTVKKPEPPRRNTVVDDHAGDRKGGGGGGGGKERQPPSQPPPQRPPQPPPPHGPLPPHYEVCPEFVKQERERTADEQDVSRKGQETVVTNAHVDGGGAGLWIRDTVMDHYEFSTEISRSHDKQIAPLGEMLEPNQPAVYEVPIKKAMAPSKPARSKNKHVKSVEQQLADRRSWGDPYALTPVSEVLVQQRQDEEGKEKEHGKEHGKGGNESRPRAPSRPAPPPPYESKVRSSVTRPPVSPYAVSMPNLPEAPLEG